MTVFHFLPAAGILIYLLPFYGLPAETKYLFWSQSFLIDFGVKRLFFILLYDLQNFLYLFASLALVRRCKPSGSVRSVRAGSAHMTWLRFLLSLMTAYVLLDLVVAVVHYTAGTQLLDMQYIPMAVFSVLVYSISFLALQDPDRLFPGYFTKSKPVKRSDNSEEIRNQLLAMMEERKLYRNNNLRYSDLAASLGISVSQLSRLMNQEIGMSFNEFVNTYRVRDAKERLNRNQGEEHTMLALAFDAGFNSKASFNRIFKQYTGLTPSEYAKRHNKNSV